MELVPYSARVTLRDRIRYAATKTPFLRGRWREVIGAVLTAVFSGVYLRIWGPPGDVSAEWLVASGFATAVVVLVVGEYAAHFLRAGASVLADRMRAANTQLKGLVDQNQELQSALAIEDWNYEEERLGDLARDFWAVLQKAAERYAPGSEHVQRRRTLTDICHGATWPDEQPGEDHGEEDVGRELLQKFAEAVYPEVGNSAVGDGGFIAFDTNRRALTGRFRRWAMRLPSGQGDELREWLVSQIKPSHETTLKMLWYMEIALAKRTVEVEAADYGYLAAIRDVFTDQAVSV